MQKSLAYIFWGYLLVFLAIRIGIDFFADPVGYLLIANGSLAIAANHQAARKAGFVAIVLCVLSVPTVFMDLNLAEYGGWFYYSNLLFAGKIVLTFYLFHMLKEIAEADGTGLLADRTKRVYAFFMSTNLAMLAFTAVHLVVESTFLETIAFLLLLLVLISNISFLLLIRTFRKKEDRKTILIENEGVY